MPDTTPSEPRACGRWMLNFFLADVRTGVARFLRSIRVGTPLDSRSDRGRRWRP